MSTLWQDRFAKARIRPNARVRRARPGVEGLERRLALSITSNLINGQLQVTDTSAVDVVTLDHSGSTTFVNGTPFADGGITKGIQITVGTGVGKIDTVNIRATVKPVTVDGQNDLRFVTLGKNGSVQDILAPVSFSNFLPEGFTDGGGDVTVDDSADPFGRTVTLNVADGTTTLSNLAPATISFDDTVKFLTLDGGSGGNTFNVLDTPHEVFGLPPFSFGHFPEVFLNSGLGNDTVNVLRSFSISLDIDGQAGGDLVNLGSNGSVQGILSRVRIGNAAGFTALSVDDSADADARTVTLNVTSDVITGALTGSARAGTITGLAPGEIDFSQEHMNFVRIQGGRGGNTFNVEETFKNGRTSDITRIDTGFGTDRVFVHRTAGNLEINGQSGGDIVDISSAPFPGGSLLGILGNVTITNQFSRSMLIMNGAADAFNRTVTLAASATLGEIRNLAPGVIFYTPNDISLINLNGGSGNDTFFVDSTASPAPLQIDGLGGNDTFIVGNNRNTLDEILTPLTLNGDSGFDTLIVNDQGSTVGRIYGVTTSTVTRLGGNAVTVNYSGIDALQLNRSTAPFTFNPDPFFPQVKNLTLRGPSRAGRSARLSGRLVDGDKGDVLSLAVDWGDGSAPDRSAPNRKPFARTHRYAAPGDYTVRVIWTDSAGVSNFRDLRLTVAAAKPGAAPSGHARGHRLAAPRR
jgi:hypothetical protein